MVNAC